MGIPPPSHVKLNSLDGDDVGDPEVNDYFLDARRNTPSHIDLTSISAIYELGVTTGKNGTWSVQKGTFDPNGLVTRAQMASFIMRALGHTNLRPAGITAQHTPDETQVSVRSDDGNFTPVVNERVEVFYSNFADYAFDSSGECVARFVDAYTPSFEACEIDRGDERTDDLGNHTFPFGTQLSNTLSIMCTAPSTSGGTVGSYTLTVDAPSSIAQFTAWAWRGDLYEDVDSRTDLFRVEPANPVTSGAEASHAVVSGGPTQMLGAGTPTVTTDDGYEHIKMGETLTYTVQLSVPALGPDGAVIPNRYLPAAPSAGENYGFSVTIIKHYQAAGDPTTDPPTPPSADFPFVLDLASEQTRLPGVYDPDSSGAFKVRVTNPDPLRAGALRDNRDVQVQIVVSPLSGNDLTLADSTTGTIIPSGGNGTESGLANNVVTSRAARFSDNDPNAAVVSIEPETTLKVLAETDRNSVSVSVVDQYNDPFRPPSDGYSVVIDPSSITDDTTTTDVNEADGASVAIRSFGRGSYGYRYGGGSTPSIETIVVQAATIDLATDTVSAATTQAATATVYWAGLGSVVRETTGQRIFLADASQRLIAIEVTGGTAGEPIVYEYGDQDRFVVEGEVVSFEQFEAIITAAPTAVSLTGSLDSTTAIGDNATLQWDDYRRSGLSRRPTTDATWRLDDLAC